MGEGGASGPDAARARSGRGRVCAVDRLVGLLVLGAGIRTLIRYHPHLRTAGHRSGLGPITLRTRPACQPRAQPVTACGVGVLGDVVARCGDDIVGTNAVTRHGRALPRTRPTPRGRTTSRTGDSKYKVTSVTALVEAPLSHPESTPPHASGRMQSHVSLAFVRAAWKCLR